MLYVYMFFFISPVSSPSDTQIDLHFNPWQIYSSRHRLNFHGKNSAMLQLLNGERRDCRGRRCTTELRGHNRGTEMKEKKKVPYTVLLLLLLLLLREEEEEVGRTLDCPPPPAP